MKSGSAYAYDMVIPFISQEYPVPLTFVFLLEQDAKWEEKATANETASESIMWVSGCHKPIIQLQRKSNKKIQLILAEMKTYPAGCNPKFRFPDGVKLL